MAKAYKLLAGTHELSGEPFQGGRIGAGIESIFDEPGVQAVNTSGLNGNVRNIAGLELPAKLFGKKRFKAGDKIEFGSTFFSHCRAYKVEWKAGLVLRGK